MADVVEIRKCDRCGKMCRIDKGDRLVVRDDEGLIDVFDCAECLKLLEKEVVEEPCVQCAVFGPYNCEKHHWE